jgi:sugar phosphate isomerase/epimerase
MAWTLGCTTRPFADVPLDEACRRIAEAGYTDVALFAGVQAETPRPEVLAVREMVLGAGLVPLMLIARAQLDLGEQEAIAAYKRLIDNAAALGARWLLELGTSKLEYYERYVSVLRQAAPYAAQAGIGITVKPHGGITRTTEDLLAVHRQVDHPAYRICYDPGNIVYYTKGEEQPRTHVDRVAPLVETCIIKDCILRDGKPDVMITPGEGMVDFDAVLSGLIEGGFEGPLYLECVGGESIDEIQHHVQRTRLYIQDILDRLSRGQGRGCLR